MAIKHQKVFIYVADEVLELILGIHLRSEVSFEFFGLIQSATVVQHLLVAVDKSY